MLVRLEVIDRNCLVLSSTESKSSHIRSVLRLLRVSVKLPERGYCERLFLTPPRNGLSEFSGRVSKMAEPCGVVHDGHDIFDT